jgi:hypothetical protein
MKWLDAFNVLAKQASKQKAITNRDASGLILFGRAAQQLLLQHADPLDISASQAFDWYVNALQDMGWAQRGDRFIMTEAWQKTPYVDPAQLMAELSNLAALLDAHHIPFKVLRDPHGTAATYKALALDAYHKMQLIDPPSADAHGPPPAQHRPSRSSAPSKVQPPPDAPPAVVQPPPVLVDHPDGATVAVTPPPLVVPPVVAPTSAVATPLAPSRGVDMTNAPGDGASVAVVVTPPPFTVPPLVPGGQSVTVQPPPVVAHAPVVLPDAPGDMPAPDDTSPGAFYWRKHADDGDGLTPPDAFSPPKRPKKKKPEPAGGGDAAGILLLLAVLAFS